MSLDLRAQFKAFREAAPQRIHLAAHSHHYWPDAACAAHGRAVADAARLADDKWSAVFGTLVPRAQRGIAKILQLGDPATIAFAPNTHEFIVRLFSALPADRPVSVLTTDSEFHSFTRQLARLEEDGLVFAERVATEPFETFHRRFATAASAGGYDLVFVSQVFFNSGAVSGDLAALAAAVLRDDTLLAIDGYHGFMALPTDLSQIADRAFYLAGGYKYAMAGEGACFMHCPPGYAPRPRDTGWYAAFGALAGTRHGVGYGSDGSRFMGATFDPSGLHRLAAVFDWMDEIGLTVAAIHAHVLDLQALFRKEISGVASLQQARLVTPAGEPHGHFLSYETPRAQEMHDRLASNRIVTDVRNDRIRFGFGCYHTREDVAAAAAAVARVLA